MQLTQNYLLLLLHILKEGKFLLNKLSCLVGKLLQTYTSTICSKIENIPYNLIFTTKFNDSSIFNYDYCTWPFKFVIGKWICWWRHNTIPCLHTLFIIQIFCLWNMYINFILVSIYIGEIYYQFLIIQFDVNTAIWLADLPGECDCLKDR
jgi:hypothetical protein